MALNSGGRILLVLLLVCVGSVRLSPSNAYAYQGGNDFNNNNGGHNNRAQNKDLAQCACMQVGGAPESGLCVCVCV